MKLFNVSAWNGRYNEDCDVLEYLVAFDTDKEAIDWVYNKLNGEDFINNDKDNTQYLYKDIEAYETIETDNGCKLGIIEW